jgi:hypothetical protein
MMSSVGRERKFTALSDSLQHNLSLYALTAGAAGVQLLALAPASEAEIVYTPVNVMLARNQYYSLDLNHDGIADFKISDHFKFGSSYRTARLEIHPDRVGGVAFRHRTDWGDQAAVLLKGQTIGKSLRFDYGSAIMALKVILSGDPGSYGSWGAVNNGYLGLTFKIDGQVHYGWARLGVRIKGMRIYALIKDCAYETEPNKQIIAGDTGGVADDAANHELQPQFVPASSVAQKDLQPSAPSLGALSLGAEGLAIWRRRYS